MGDSYCSSRPSVRYPAELSPPEVVKNATFQCEQGGYSMCNMKSSLEADWNPYVGGSEDIMEWKCVPKTLQEIYSGRITFHVFSGDRYRVIEKKYAEARRRYAHLMRLASNSIDNYFRFTKKQKEKLQEAIRTSVRKNKGEALVRLKDLAFILMEHRADLEKAGKRTPPSIGIALLLLDIETENLYDKSNGPERKSLLDLYKLIKMLYSTVKNLQETRDSMYEPPTKEYAYTCSGTRCESPTNNLLSNYIIS